MMVQTALASNMDTPAYFWQLVPYFAERQNWEKLQAWLLSKEAADMLPPALYDELLRSETPYQPTLASLSDKQRELLLGLGHLFRQPSWLVEDYLPQAVYALPLPENYQTDLLAYLNSYAQKLAYLKDTEQDTRFHAECAQLEHFIFSLYRHIFEQQTCPILPVNP